MINAMWGNYQTQGEPVRRHGSKAPRRIVMRIGRTSVDVIQGTGIRMLLVTRTQG